MCQSTGCLTLTNPHFCSQPEGDHHKDGPVHASFWTCLIFSASCFSSRGASLPCQTPPGSVVHSWCRSCCLTPLLRRPADCLEPLVDSIQAPGVKRKRPEPSAAPSEATFDSPPASKMPAHSGDFFYAHGGHGAVSTFTSCSLVLVLL